MQYICYIHLILFSICVVTVVIQLLMHWISFSGRLSTVSRDYADVPCCQLVECWPASAVTVQSNSGVTFGAEHIHGAD